MQMDGVNEKNRTEAQERIDLYKRLKPYRNISE